jgi:glucokinase
MHRCLVSPQGTVDYACAAVLTFGATGGVYLAGGVLPRLGAAFDVGAFMEGFTAKGRFADYVARAPVRLIIHPYPALLGAAAYLRDAPELPTAPEENRILK